VFPERLCRATDPESGLECSLTVLRAGDRGASAVVVELRNLSTSHDVVLSVNTDLTAFVMLTVTDAHGVVLSSPARRFHTGEVMYASVVPIPRASSHRWRVPIAAQLSEFKIPEQGLEGRLVVNLALLFDTTSGAAEPTDANFTSSLVTLYDMDVLFTRAALTEGTKFAQS
jgi:hypothetical protein